MNRSDTHIRSLLRASPEKKRALDEARAAGAAAAERLYMSAMQGDEDGIVIIAVSRSGRVHIKDYGRAK